MMSSTLEMEIKIALIRKNMSQKDLAKAVGISGTYMSEIITGKKTGKKPAEHIDLIKKVLGIKEN